MSPLQSAGLESWQLASRRNLGKSAGLISQLKLAFYDFLQVPGAVSRCGTTTAINLINNYMGRAEPDVRPPVRVESQCSYFKFISQQWQLTSNCKNCIAFYRRTTWHMHLRQLTVYENFRWVDMRAITFLFVGQSSSRVWL